MLKPNEYSDDDKLVCPIETNKIHNMDCLEGMKLMLDNSVDLIVTDPPYQLDTIKRWGKSDMNKEIYELGQLEQGGTVFTRGHKGFMGKEWDVLPKQEIWNEMLRVLKSGAFAFIMMTPRQDSQWRTCMMLERAGFIISFTPLYWAYASGFPKASNISKMVDKRNQNLHLLKDFKNYIKEKRIEKGFNKLELGREIYNWSSKREDVPIQSWESGKEVPTKKDYNKLKKILKLDNRFDILIDRIEAEREVIGKDGRNAKESIFNIGVQKEWDITKSSTPQAKSLNGSYGGFQPKPAVELILVAMKPCTEKTYVNQALKNKKGITWLDDCRIPYESEDDKELGISERISVSKGYETYGDPNSANFNRTNRRDLQGRFPANLLVSDDVLNDGTKHKSGDCPNGFKGDFSSNVYGKYANNLINPETIYADSGSFSRYFDLDKWFINKLPESVRKTFPFMIVPKASSSEKNRDIKSKRPSGVLYNEEEPDGFRDTLKHNIHPTCKPIQLMSYLITLGSRKNDLILDPFIGSGTTAISSRLLTRNFIGFELNKEYHKIALARIKDYIEQKKLAEVLI